MTNQKGNNMTKEKTDLLTKDICARLLHNVKCLVSFDDGTKEIMTLKTGLPNSFGNWDFYNENCSGCSNKFKPYLRSMYTMTDEETKEYLGMLNDIDKSGLMNQSFITKVVDWLDKKMFDHRGLIPMGIALEASEGMY